jgi:hypothetical protein
VRGLQEQLAPSYVRVIFANEVVGHLPQAPAYVSLVAEPQLPAVDEAGNEHLANEPTGAAVGSRDRSRLVEHRTRIEYLEDGGHGLSQNATASR